MRRITTSIVRSWLPPRKKDAHKGTEGRVLIIAGSRGMAGAAVLCASAAARSGAGLVRLGIVKSQQANAVKRAPLEITTVGLPENSRGQLSSSSFAVVREIIKRFCPTVVAIGPGLGLSASTKNVVAELLRNFSGPVVLDADGLNALARLNHNLHRGALILTPHSAELGRLLKWTTKKISANRIAAVKEGARRFRAVCILKGAGTLVSDGKTVWKNTTGNAAMASGGMGDVLTGMVAALWAQMGGSATKALPAACVGVFLHGRAADKALASFPERTMLASDLVSFMPIVFKSTFYRRKI